MGSIFISHSCRGDPYAEIVRDAVKEKLERRGHKVLLDKARLEPGDEWRSVLYQWLAECDGGIVLLNAQALQSDWVAREATMLLWRRALGAPVQIVPVLLGALGPQGGEADWFRELMALQAVSGDGPGTGEAEAEALAGRAVSRIGDITALPDENAPFGKWLRDVAECLSGASPEYLKAAARRLKVRDDDWHDATSLPGPQKFLAYQLLARRLDIDIVEAIAELVRGLSRDRLERLVELIRPTWVDAEAARQLVAAPRPGEPAAAADAGPLGPFGRPDPENWIFGINADIPGTLHRYIDRATCCAVYGYRTATPSGALGEAVTEELLRQCETAIRQKLAVHSGRAIDERDFDPRRVKRAFLVFDPDLADPGQLAEVARTLHARYPPLTILVATGRQWQSSDQVAAAFGVPELHLVEPRLDGDVERDGDQLSGDLELMVTQARPLTGAA